MLLNTHVDALHFTFSKYSCEVISAETVYGEQPKTLLMLYSKIEKIAYLYLSFIRFRRLWRTSGESFPSLIFKFSASEGSGG